MEKVDLALDLVSIGREVSTQRMRTLRCAIRAVFVLIALSAVNGAMAQGGPCLSGCDDDQLPPWIITPGGSGGGWQPHDPCGGFSCNGGGNDVPPDEGGGSGAPPQPTACENFLRTNRPPSGCTLASRIEEPAFGRGCNFFSPSFLPMFQPYVRHFAAACNMQMQCYWTTEDKRYCDDRVSEEAYGGCASQASTSAERAACVDKAGSFTHYMAEKTKDINMMPYPVVRTNVECARWKGRYHAVCR